MCKTDGSRVDLMRNATPPYSCLTPDGAGVQSLGSDAKNVVYSVEGPPSLACPLCLVSVRATTSRFREEAHFLMSSRLFMTPMPPQLYVAMRSVVCVRMVGAALLCLSTSALVHCCHCSVIVEVASWALLEG